MEPALRETMLVQGQVDAITGFTFTSLLNLNARGVKDEDVVMMKYADNGVKLYGNVIIASQKFIDQNPKAVAGFLRALTRGMKDGIADQAYAIQVLKEGRRHRRDQQGALRGHRRPGGVRLRHQAGAKRGQHVQFELSPAQVGTADFPQVRPR
jgi:ABC-type nitrate/sulfonate/bicarbonate transport system substrate-binding protein